MLKKIKTYTDINGFHKYWGKKPLEYYEYFINTLTNKGDIVLEPFLGSANVISILDDTRKFIGIDINPFSKTFADFLINLPTQIEYDRALADLERKVKGKIDNVYINSDKRIATHYIWQNDKITEVWVKDGNKKQVLAATEKDIISLDKYSGYKTKYLKDITFFNNNKINVNSDMTAYDFFTRRSLYCIDTLLDEINSIQDENIRRALLLTVTASIGQMSKMVFVINRNGRKEVGSWVIGFWLPKEHFEINVWNCFKNKASKLSKSLPVNRRILNNIEVHNCSCLDKMRTIGDNSVKLIVADPPHSNRIPYLELSEIFNAILNNKSSFDDEIVVSNANERKKDIFRFTADMLNFFRESQRVLTKNGVLVLFFNASREKDWDFFKKVCENNILYYLGYTPMEYSSKSVVQSNRKGALSNDYILFFSKSNKIPDSISSMNFFNKGLTPFSI